MRRRELLAGVASLGVVGGGGYLALRGPAAVADVVEPAGEGSERDGVETHDPLEIETVEATGSRAGTVTVPDPETLTFVDFFATWCGPCKEQMPAIAEASDRAPDGVRFLSVTDEPVGRTLPEDELRAWWDRYEGDWLLGVDRTSRLSVRYGATSLPTAVIVAGDGRAVWSHQGVLSSERLLAEVRAAVEDG